jgi:hypothetical protein
MALAAPNVESALSSWKLCLFKGYLIDWGLEKGREYFMCELVNSLPKGEGLISVYVTEEEIQLWQHTIPQQEDCYLEGGCSGRGMKCKVA